MECEVNAVSRGEHASARQTAPGREYWRKMGVYDQVKLAFQDILAPQLAEIRGELKAELAEVRNGTRALRGLLKAELAEVCGEVKALQGEVRRLDEKIDALSDKVDLTSEFRERLAALEAKMR